MANRVRKAVFPVAGLGTRLLPATKTHPQGDDHDRRPAADPICGRRSARGGDRAADLRHRPRQIGAGRLFRPWPSSSRRRCASKGKSLDVARAVERAASARSSPSASSSRWGSATRSGARAHIVGDEPFAVLLPDELMVGTPGALAQMVEAYEQVGGNLVARSRKCRDERDQQIWRDRPRRERRAR